MVRTGVVLGLAIFLYFLPSFLVLKDIKKEDRLVLFGVNLFFGWIVILWGLMFFDSIKYLIKHPNADGGSRSDLFWYSGWFGDGGWSGWSGWSGDGGDGGDGGGDLGDLGD